LVNLTKTEKKGRAGKESLVEEVRKSVDKYEYIWVFSVENMRNNFLKDIRNEWKTSRFFFGKNKVMAKALGTTPEDEYKEGLKQLSDELAGNVGILFTNSGPDEVKGYFADFRHADYVRSGGVATQTVVISAGPVKRGEDPFPHNMEAQLRALGMPTKLKSGVVTLDAEYTICKVGDTLTTHQASLLKLFYYQLAEFQVKLLCYYHNGEIHQADAMDEDKDA